MGFVTFIGQRCRGRQRITGAVIAGFTFWGTAALANCPVAIFASVTKDGLFFDAPGGNPIEQFKAGDTYAYTFEIVGCEGGWMKVLYYGDRRHRWIVADKIGRLGSWVELNKSAVAAATADAVSSGASGVSGLPRLGK